MFWVWGAGGSFEPLEPPLLRAWTYIAHANCNHDILFHWLLWLSVLVPRTSSSALTLTLEGAADSLQCVLAVL